VMGHAAAFVVSSKLAAHSGDPCFSLLDKRVV
jgi:hypothetical protein